MILGGSDGLAGSTDNKLPLDSREKSRGLRELLQFNVDVFPCLHEIGGEETINVTAKWGWDEGKSGKSRASQTTTSATSKSRGS